MKRTNFYEINGIKFKCNNKDLSKKMLVYMLTFDDNSCYIGKTKRNLISRLVEHCSNFSNKRTKKNDRINRFKSFNVEVLSTAKKDTSLFKKETVLINNAKSLGYCVLNE